MNGDLRVCWLFHCDWRKVELIIQKWSIWSKKRSIRKKKKRNEKKTSWIGREPDGRFDIKKSLWHFKKAVPEWFPRNFRKAWYKAHRYLSNIHSNLLFYLQTETYVSRPFAAPPSVQSLPFNTLIYWCRISPCFSAFLFLFLTFFLLICLSSSAPTITHQSIESAVDSTLDGLPLHSSIVHCSSDVFVCAMLSPPLGPLRACIWNILERHIFAVLEHKGICHGRGCLKWLHRGNQNQSEGFEKP